jgi:hypothetical protein
MASQVQVGESRTNVRNDWRRYAAVKLSTEYDSEGAVFVNKLSARMLNGLAKLTGSVQREPGGDFRYPLFGVVTKYLSVLYDHEDKNALVTVSADIGRNLQVKYLRDVKVRGPSLSLSLSRWIFRLSILGSWNRSIFFFFQTLWVKICRHEQRSSAPCQK